VRCLELEKMREGRRLLLGSCSSLDLNEHRNYTAGLEGKLTREVSFALVGAVVFALQIIPFDSEILIVRLGPFYRTYVANST
jgi:hypothetical protein